MRLWGFLGEKHVHSTNILIKRASQDHCAMCRSEPLSVSIESVFAYPILYSKITCSVVNRYIISMEVIFKLGIHTRTVRDNPSFHR